MSDKKDEQDVIVFPDLKERFINEAWTELEEIVNGLFERDIDVTTIVGFLERYKVALVNEFNEEEESE